MDEHRDKKLFVMLFYSYNAGIALVVDAFTFSSIFLFITMYGRSATTAPGFRELNIAVASKKAATY